MNDAADNVPRIPMIEVESSQIHSIGHDPDTNTLAIKFYKGFGANKAPGSLYHYSGFSPEDFEAFKTSESLGKHFGDHIKSHTDKYPYQRINEQSMAAD